VLEKQPRCPGEQQLGFATAEAFSFPSGRLFATKSSAGSSIRVLSLSGACISPEAFARHFPDTHKSTNLYRLCYHFAGRSGPSHNTRRKQEHVPKRLFPYALQARLLARHPR
jgi:hypothetical protein